MADLTTHYLGLELKHPLIAGASPLSYEIDSIRRLEDGGAAAVVLHSLFEEQLAHEARVLDHFLSSTADSHAEANSYFPEPDEFKLGPEEYLEHIAKAKRAVNIPVIASLNGISTGGWVSFAREMQEAGADALELNVYYVPVDPALSGSAVEQRYLDVVWNVSRAVEIPVAVKIGPQFSAPVNMAQRLAEAGADALVLFNRFYQPDIDLEELEVAPNLVLSQSNELRLPLRWIALMYGRVEIELAATTGVHAAVDAIKMLLAGAQVVQMCSALLRYGPKHFTTVLRGLMEWMEEHEYAAITELRGALSQRSCPEPTAFERANYMKTLQSFSGRV